MTLRDLIKCVATDNHATYKVTKFGYNHTLDIEADHCAVKQWHIILK